MENHGTTEPDWKLLLRMGEELARLPTVAGQCHLIEATAGQLMGGEAQVWLANPAYPLPGDHSALELLPDARATDLAHRARLEAQTVCAKSLTEITPCCPEDGPVYVAVPLQIGLNLLGILQYEHPQETPLSLEGYDLLQNLAAHAAVALETARQEWLKNWRYEQLALVRSVSGQIANLLDLDVLCTTVVRLIRETFQYYYVAIFLLQENSHTLRGSAAAYQVSPETPREDVILRLGEGMVGSVAQTGERIVAPDVFKEPRYRYLDVLPETLSEVSLPLKIENQVLGVLDVQSNEFDAFHEIDLLVLSALADNIAVAVQSARLYTDLRTQAEHISSVVEVSHALNSIIDLDLLLDEVVYLIHQRFGYPYVHIFSVHMGRRLVIYQAGSGERSGAMRTQEIAYSLDSPTGIIPWVARTGETRLVNNVNEEPLYVPAELPPYNTGSELSIPLKIGEEVIGILDIQSAEEGAFSVSDQQLFEALGASIAIAYRNASLYRTEKWRRRVADSFRDVAYQVSTSADLDRLLNTILLRLEDNLPCEASAIWLLEEEMDAQQPFDERELRLAAVRGLESGQLNQLYEDHPEAFSTMKAILEAEQPYIRAQDEPMGPLGTALGLPTDYSAIAAPLRAGNRPLGVLSLAHPTFGRYGSEAQSITSTFASYAAVAIQNAQLYAESRAQAWVSTMLVQVAEASQTTLTLDDLLGTMLRMARLLTGVRKCAFLLREESAPYFELKAWFGFEPTEAGPVILPVTTPGLARLAQDKAVLFLSDAVRELGLPALASRSDGHTLVALPLLVRSDLIGAFVVTLQTSNGSVGERGFDPKTLAVLQGIAHQTSQSVLNIRLAEARQEEAYVTAALLQVAQAVVSAGELPDTLETIVNLLPILVGIDACIIYRWDEPNHLFRPTNAYTGNRRVEQNLLSILYPAGEHELLDCVVRQAAVQITQIPTADMAVEDWPELRCRALDEYLNSAPPPPGDWVMGFPLIAQGRMLGVLVVREKNTTPAFWERRMEIINGIAQQTSMAIQNDILKKETVANERFEQEMRLARQIQETFLPTSLPGVEGWEIDLRWRTARQVGGDFYDVFPLENGHIGLVVADVSDKGLPAALYMTVVRTLIRATVRNHLDPADVLEVVNDLLYSDSPEAMFITTVYAVLDPQAGELIYANAGHNLPLLARAEDHTLETLPKGGTALGVVHTLGLTNHHIPIQYGDLLMIYTDGVTDLLSPDGDSFGEERLRDVLQEHGTKPLTEMLAALDLALSDFQQDMPAFDDLTLVVLRRTPNLDPLPK
jgi:phosphoserine phosphatase RsbU/P